jgi:hypothetical protein
VAHERRIRFAARIPQHVTLRLRDGVGSVRRDRALRVFKRAIVAGRRPDFAVVHFNVLANHVHLVVEAGGAAGLARGIQGLAVRLARGWNRVLGRKGKLFAERYHVRALKTPREVRVALKYVLLNGRHHAAQRGERLGRFWIDPFSSGVWFDGWRQPIAADEPWLKELLREPCPTAPPVSWLLSTGWRRGGLLAFDEVTGRGTVGRGPRIDRPHPEEARSLD